MSYADVIRHVFEFRKLWYVCVVSPQDWADQQASRVAAAVRDLRKMRGRSAQWVADRTTDLGYPISRATIADLENGRRKWVTISELMILARALNAPPIALLYPEPLDDDLIEILPGLQGSKMVGLQWFSGESDTPAPGICDDADEYRRNLKPVADARRISDLVSQKLTLMKVFTERTDKDTREGAIPEITRIQREIDRLRGTDGG
jgi:transcriptional regulator with XRE-family HTH domain